ncbi:hypothetical protein EV122DRAFT_285364 [Schizophyllum commune]
MSQYASGDLVCHDDGIYMVFGTAPNLSSEQSALTKEKQGRSRERSAPLPRLCAPGAGGGWRFIRGSAFSGFLRSAVTARVAAVEGEGKKGKGKKGDRPARSAEARRGG